MIKISIKNIGKSPNDQMLILFHRPPRHTLDIDVTSQTFADVKFRYASHNNGITSSVSYPAGFVGFQLTRRSPSQYYAKLFTRSLVRKLFSLHNVIV